MKTISVEPVLSYYLNEVGLDCSCCAMYFAQYFRGERTELKFSKVNRYFICSLFKSKKEKTRKKDKDKLVLLEFDSKSFAAIIK